MKIAFSMLKNVSAFCEIVIFTYAYPNYVGICFLLDLIDRVSKIGILTPNTTWQKHTYNGPAATLVYKLRLVCDEHYYGPSCTVYCKPRSDRYGHNTCDSNGNRVCLPGWSGPYCNIRK